MSQPTRSIIITFDKKEFATGNEFSARLAELRARHPQWNVRGMVLPRDVPFVPKRPALRSEQLTLRNEEMPVDDGGSADYIATYLTGVLARKESQKLKLELLANAHRPRNDLDDEASGVSSDDFMEGPRVGSTVRMRVAPYTGRNAIISEWQTPHRVKVSLLGQTAGTAEWWCCADDFELISDDVLDFDGTEEEPTSLSTLKERETQARRLRYLEETLRRLTKAVGWQKSDVADLMMDFTSEGDGTRYLAEVLGK